MLVTDEQTVTVIAMHEVAVVEGQKPNANFVEVRGR